MECNYLTNEQKMRHFEPQRRKHDLQKLARAVIMATGQRRVQLKRAAKKKYVRGIIMLWMQQSRAAQRHKP